MHLHQVVMKKIFEYFLDCVFLFLKPRAPLDMAWPFWILGPPFEETCYMTTTCYILNFKHLRMEVLEKKMFEYFPMYFMVKAQDPMGQSFTTNLFSV